MSGTGKVVCVTGAAGYIASWLVKLLLLRGYTVKATVRNLSDPNKVLHLKELEGAEERLHLYEANLLEDGSFDSIIDGCDGVFHTASPVILSVNDPQAELVEPAVNGTLNVLKSCSKVTSVRRVVITSSIVAATTNRNVKGPDVIVDETWFADPEYCKQNKKWYPLSKTLADEAAWKFAKENGLDLVTMHPGFVLGPLVQPTLNLSSGIIADLVKGTIFLIIDCIVKKETVPYRFTNVLIFLIREGETIFAGKKVLSVYDFVDMKDVCNAHILAFENPAASGRYCLVGTVVSHSEAQQILQKLYPCLSFPNNCKDAEKSVLFQVSKKKAESLGVDFTPLEVSLKGIVESLKERNFLDF